MQEDSPASEHEEQDAWHGLQTLLLSYVPAGQLAMHSFFKGLRLFLEHFVQVMRAVEDLLAEGSSEHSAQSVMPPLALSLQGRHFFLPPALSLGKYPALQVAAVTQLAGDPSFKYRSAWHSVQVAGVFAAPDVVHFRHPSTPFHVSPDASPHETHLPGPFPAAPRKCVPSAQAVQLFSSAALHVLQL